MGIFHPNTSQPKSVWRCHCPSNLFKVTRRICDRGSELRQNPASNSSFLSRASTVFLAFPARINEIERSQGPTAREAEFSGSSDWLSSPLAELGMLHSPSDPQQLCRSSASKLTTVCVHILACHWWGHFHLPFIYWATFLTLPLGWSLLSSSLVCSLWFICKNWTQQVCGILLMCKQEDDINMWRSHMPVFSLKTYRFH